MKYIVVSRETRCALVRAVNSLMAEGWIPVGGVSVAVARSSNDWSQAMTRNKAN